MRFFSSLRSIFSQREGLFSMSKNQVINPERRVRRILRAAVAAKFPIEQIEFAPDGTIVVKPKASTPNDESAENEWDRKYEPSAA